MDIASADKRQSGVGNDQDWWRLFTRSEWITQVTVGQLCFSKENPMGSCNSPWRSAHMETPHRYKTLLSIMASILINWRHLAAKMLYPWNEGLGFQHMPSNGMQLWSLKGSLSTNDFLSLVMPHAILLSSNQEEMRLALQAKGDQNKPQTLTASWNKIYILSQQKRPTLRTSTASMLSLKWTNLSHLPQTSTHS